MDVLTSHSQHTLNKIYSDLHTLRAKHPSQDEASQERKKLAGNIFVLLQGDLKRAAQDRHKVMKETLLSLFFQKHKPPK